MAIQHEWKLNIPESINTSLDQHQFQYFIFFCIFIIFEFVLTNGKFENPLNWHDTSLFFQWNRSQMYHMLLVTSYSLFNLQILYLLNLWSKIEPLLSLLFATWSRTICCTHIPRINQNNFISTKKTQCSWTTSINYSVVAHSSVSSSCMSTTLVYQQFPGNFRRKMLGFYDEGLFFQFK